MRSRQCLLRCAMPRPWYFVRRLIGISTACIWLRPTLMDATVNSGKNILSANISVDYPGKKSVLRDVALDIAQGEILGLVGESGSGKSTLSLAILGLLSLKNATARGHIIFRDRDLLALPQRDFRQLRGNEIALVLQSPHTSLNPALKIN